MSKILEANQLVTFTTKKIISLLSIVNLNLFLFLVSGFFLKLLRSQIMIADDSGIDLTPGGDSEPIPVTSANRQVEAMTIQKSKLECTRFVTA